MVRLPGRAGRRREAPIEAMEPLVEQMGAAIGPLLPPGYAIVGQCLGGLIGYELARWLAENGFRRPAHLFLSGCGSPEANLSSKNIAEMGDNTLVEQLRRWGGTPEEVLVDPSIMRVLLAALRSDLRLFSRYVHRRHPALNVPLTVLRGRSDQEITWDAISSWRSCTTADFEARELEGGHFPAPNLITELIRAKLSG